VAGDAGPGTSLEARAAHIPVMVKEVLDLLITDSGGAYADCTLGSAGHSLALLEALAPSARLVGLDLDPAALETAAERLEAFSDRVELFHASYVELEAVLAEAGVEALDGALFDLGLSSLQLADGSRGFAHSAEGPLDMRFDTSRGATAAELLNRLSRRRLAKLLGEFGEIRRPGAVSAAIDRARSVTPLRTTTDLVRAVEPVLPRGPSRPRRLAQIFMALRIAVNGELEALAGGLDAAGRCLRTGGVLAVISYHSLEDRLVKRFFKNEGWEILTKKPLTPSEAEMKRNPRARSAKLRAAVKRGPVSSDGGGGRWAR